MSVKYRILQNPYAFVVQRFDDSLYWSTLVSLHSKKSAIDYLNEIEDGSRDSDGVKVIYECET